MAKRSQVVKAAETVLGPRPTATAQTSRDKRRAAGPGSPNRRKPTEPKAMKKDYVVLTEKARIGGKTFDLNMSEKDRTIKCTIDEATTLRERGIALRFPTEPADKAEKSPGAK